MRKITKIESNLPLMPTRKKVAAYARVSVGKDRAMHSLSAQVSHYSEFIQRHGEWEYVGVYADLAVTGTSSDRTEFQKLLADCENGAVDIVLTKSISRFARNTVDLLETVRHLKDIGVEVRFEKEGINSMSSDGELMLSILASFAQEEVHSLSENVKWGTRKRFADGIPNGKFRILGYAWEGDTLVVVPEEAAIVKRIFDNFLMGKSRLETERELNDEGLRTKQGYLFCDSNIKCILTNITYTGNMMLQKYFTEDPLTHKRKRNNGELPMYYIENTHEPIIDRDTFDFVQAEMSRRRELGIFANKSLNVTAFTSKIKCGQCGQNFHRKLKKPSTGIRYALWCCATKDKKGVANCDTKNIREDILMSVCTEVLGLSELDEVVFSEKVTQIIAVGDNTLIFHLTDGTEVVKEWVSTAKKDCWTDERRQTAAERLSTRNRSNKNE